MKKLDKLVIFTFLGPFFITFCVVVFIFLCQFLLGYFEEIVGKDLGWQVYGKLIFYFAVNMTPNALPLAVLLSTIMTYGNLGEHHELTTIKSSGISLIRVLLPVFIFILGLTYIAFLFNNNVLPYTNLKAYSLLYDVRQKKPALDFKEGTFYYGLPGYAVKISSKSEDGQGIKDVLIYDHTNGYGNTSLIIADSGSMYMFNNNNYMVLELFNGTNYKEVINNKSFVEKQFIKKQFDTSKVFFDLSSFDLSRTDENLFASNKIMRNIKELAHDVDSIETIIEKRNSQTYTHIAPYYYNYRYKGERVQKIVEGINIDDKELQRFTNYSLNKDQTNQMFALAASEARASKSYCLSVEATLANQMRERNSFKIEFHKKFALAVACIIMFFIGAPLGAIIKKGGLGVPVLISIIFFIIYYVITLLGEKYAKESVVSVEAGVWAANIILLPIGLFFLRQAKNDSRILDADFILVLIDKWADKLKKIFKRN